MKRKDVFSFRAIKKYRDIFSFALADSFNLSSILATRHVMACTYFYSRLLIKVVFTVEDRSGKATLSCCYVT